MSEAPPYSIEIDRDLCMGSGVCSVFAPNTFELAEDIRVTVCDAAGDDLARIRSAVDGCPTGAIRLVGTDSPGTGPEA